jgi:tripartite-type tricarboxylate transporter receptor subunit TctC
MASRSFRSLLLHAPSTRWHRFIPQNRSASSSLTRLAARTTSLRGWMGARLGAVLGQPINRGGAGGTIEADVAAKAPPDDYTLFMAAGAHALAPSGHVELAFMTLSATAPHVKAGKLRGLAVTNSRRSSIVPELSTVAEAGLPGYEMSTWWGLLAPSKTPADIVQKLNAVAVNIIAEPDFSKRLSDQGLEAESMPPQQLGAFVKEQKDKYAKVAKTAGVKPE